MSYCDVLEDARSVWLYGTEPKFTIEEIDAATEALFEELLAGGRKPNLGDPRLRLLMNARHKLSEVQR